MILVIDTSVVVKWFVDEPGREPSRQLLRPHYELAAPDFVIAEVANVLWRKQRAGDIRASQVEELLLEFPKFFRHLATASSIVLDALALARELEHSIYDCMFLALAAQLPDARLVTVDDRFIAKVDATGHRRLLRSVSEFSPVTEFCSHG